MSNVISQPMQRNFFCNNVSFRIKQPLHHTSPMPSCSVRTFNNFAASAWFSMRYWWLSISPPDWKSSLMIGCSSTIRVSYISNKESGLTSFWRNFQGTDEVLQVKFQHITTGIGVTLRDEFVCHDKNTILPSLLALSLDKEILVNTRSGTLVTR